MDSSLKCSTISILGASEFIIKSIVHSHLQGGPKASHIIVYIYQKNWEASEKLDRKQADKKTPQL